MAQPELFTNTFYKWLEANGVTFTEPTILTRPAHSMPTTTAIIGPPFKATIDLNALKVGVAELAEYLPRLDAHEHLHDPDMVPPGMCEFCDEERLPGHPTCARCGALRDQHEGADHDWQWSQITARPSFAPVAEDVELCGCTNEELEAGRTCGQPQCPNRGEGK